MATMRLGNVLGTCGSTTDVKDKMDVHGRRWIKLNSRRSDLANDRDGADMTNIQLG